MFLKPFCGVFIKNYVLYIYQYIAVYYINRCVRFITVNYIIDTVLDINALMVDTLCFPFHW